MKYWTMLFVGICLVCSSAMGAELSEEVLEKLRDKVKIAGVNDSTEKGDDDVKMEVLKFYTYQDEDSADEFKFRVHVVVELEDKKDNTYFAMAEKYQGEVDSEYTGEDTWEFKVKHGDLNRPKLSAYAIRYGIVVKGKDGKSVFKVLAEEYDDVDTLDELKERTTTQAESNTAIFHQYNFRTSDEEVVQSPWR